MKIDLSKERFVWPSPSKTSVKDYCNSLELDEAVSVADIADTLCISCDHVRAQLREHGLRVYVHKNGRLSPCGASAATIAKYAKP